MSVEINETNFPGDWFRSYVSNNFDTDHDGWLSDEEIVAVTVIDFLSNTTGYKGSLKGIEFFTELTTLKTRYASYLDVSFSTLTKLRTIEIGGASEYHHNSNKEWDFSECGLLRDLTLDTVMISTIAFPSSIEVIDITCAPQASLVLFPVNLTNCQNLKSIKIEPNSTNMPSPLRGTNNKPYLETVDIPSCYLNGVLDFSGDTALQTLKLYGISNVSSDQQASLNLTECTSLTELNCTSSYNLTGTLDLSTCSSLIAVYCRYTCFTGLILGEANSRLAKLLIYGPSSKPAIESIDLTTTPILANQFENYTPVTNHDTYYGSAACDYYSYGDAASQSALYCDIRTRIIDLSRGIEINATNFPDPLFRNYVSTFDLDEDGWLSKSEIQKVTFFSPPQLDVGSMTSLKGLEYFTELTEIQMFANVSQIPQDRAQITSIDLSRCTKLKVLYIHHLNLLTIDLSNNVDLERISIQNCSISDIDLSHNLKVWDLVLWYNSNLDDIDVTMLEELTRFQIRPNFTSINISNNRKLYLLDVIENRSMTSVDISCNPDLCVIYSYKSGVKVWDFTGHRSLYNASQKIPQVITFSGGFKAWDFEGPNLGDLDPKLGGVSIECDIGTTFVDNGIVVVSQPTDVTVSDGENYSFIFQVSGSNLTYVWQKRANKNSPWMTLDETTNTCSGTASSSDDGYEFRCIASDNTTSKESNIVTLSVLHSPEILSDPESKNVLEGAQVTFSVTASGGDLRYQWQVSTDSGSTWNDIRYATDRDYTFVATLSMNTYQYRCLVSNDIGTVESNAAILTVTADQSLTPPTITTNPSSQEISEGNNVTFSVEASGNDLSYQWQTFKNDTWYNINGANSSSYTTLASSSLNGSRYRCLVSNAAGGVYSNAATLTVMSSGSSISTPSISTQPRSANVNDGQTAIFSLTASGGGLSFQWYIKRNGQWYPISGAANAIYSVVGRSANNGTQYRCLVTNSAGSVYSNVVTLNVQSSTPLSFYGYHSIIISGKNTYGEWEMYPTSRPHVAPPEVKTSYVDVPGADGGLDYTDLLTGEPRFGYRKGSWEFLLIPQERWPDVYRSLCNFLNGRVHTVVLEDDPTWQYTGRLSVNKWESAAHNSLITIDYILDPNPVNLDDESYSTDDDDLAAAARILRKPGNEGMVIGMFSGSATVVDPATYFEDGDNISY